MTLSVLRSHGLPRITVRQAHRLLTAGLVTSEQLCSYCYALALAGEEIWNLSAFERLIAKEQLLLAAQQSDERRLAGKTLSMLDGIPVSIKANVAVASRPLTAGSRILGAASSSMPAVGYDADVTRRLLNECGAVQIGTTSMDEFGMGSLGTNVVSRAGKEKTTPTRNPSTMLRRIRKETTKPLDDEIVSQIIRLPTDVIRDAHAQLLGFEAQDTHYSAGGSSCGGAASVAHGSSLLSLGSDTGGSIRLPAAWCGVVGLKPTYGKLSRHGLVAYASSTDTIGILAPSVDCVKQALEPLAQQVTGHDSNQTRPPMHDSLTVSSDDTDTSSASVEDSSSLLSGMKIGIPAAFSVSECPSAVRDAWSLGAHTLQRHGATVEEVTVDLVSPEVLQKSLAAYYVLVSAEASSNLARYDGFRYGTSIDPKAGHKDLEGSDFSLLEQQYACTRVEEFGKEVIRRVLCGTSVLSSDRFHTYYEAAAKLRSVLTRQLQQATAEYDLLLVPTVVFPPPEIGDEHKIDQTEQFANDVMTVPISLSGLPAVSVPVGEWDGHGRFLPGLQLVGSRHGEEALLRAAAVLEKASKR